MKTVSIKNVRYVAETGHIVAVAKDGVRYEHNQFLNPCKGILVASKIADRVGITRSVIVNALRKFESAGVIESRSSGMKGTYIKVVNDVVFDELKNA